MKCKKCDESKFENEFSKIYIVSAGFAIIIPEVNPRAKPATKLKVKKSKKLM